MTASASWLVLYTKPKNEIKVAERLTNAGFEVYCPTIKSYRIWSDRKKKISEPLFKSYLFIRIENYRRDEVFDIPGIVRYVFWLGKPAVVRDDEIAAIKEFLMETDHLETPAIEFVKDQKLKIKRGPFKELEGTYLYKNKNRIVLNVPSLGTMIQVQLHISQLI